MYRTASLGFVSFLAILWLAAAAGAASTPETLPIGSPAPDFSLPGVDGKTYTLESFKDAEILVLVFTCNHCPTAQAYEERLKQLAADYRSRKVALVAISPNDPLAVRLDELGYSDLSDSFEEMKIRAKDHDFRFPYLYDGENQRVSLAYGPVATPHAFIFDRARKLRFQGRIDNSEKPGRVTVSDARNAIDALLAGRSVPVEQTRVVGCSVKWSDKRESAAKSLETWAKEPVALRQLGEQGLRELVKNDGQKVRLINVCATWCGPCVTELPEFVTMNRMYRHRDFELVTISADSPEEQKRALEMLRTNQVSATNYLFAGGDKYKLMELVDEKSPGPVPHTILIAPGGKVLYRKNGPCDPLAVKKAVVEFLGRTYK
jgi:peroxiredoxin